MIQGGKLYFPPQTQCRWHLIKVRDELLYYTLKTKIETCTLQCQTGQNKGHAEKPCNDCRITLFSLQDFPVRPLLYLVWCCSVTVLTPSLKFKKSTLLSTNHECTPNIGAKHECHSYLGVSEYKEWSPPKSLRIYSILTQSIFSYCLLLLPKKTELAW